MLCGHRRRAAVVARLNLCICLVPECECVGELTRPSDLIHREESMTYDAGMGVIKEEANDPLPED